MSPNITKDPRRSIRSHLLASLAGATILVGGLYGWAARTEVSGAVVAAGVVVVDSNAKKVQHPTGGVVGALNVRDGDKVKAGDVVIRLDETVAKSNLAMLSKTLDELYARQARLEAERDGRDRLVFPDGLMKRVAEPDVARLIDGEEGLFDLRRLARAGLKDQLGQRVQQLREQIDGLEVQAKAKGKEIVLIHQELDGVQELWRKNLVSLSRVTALSREDARLDGERGAMIASVAQTKGKITETEMQIIQIDQDLRSEVAKELREIQDRAVELTERSVAAEDQLKRIDIRSPQTGTIHQLNVHTIGGVVAAGDTLMLIVPEEDDLSVEIKVAPQDIDQLRAGQTVMLRLSAFNQRTTPEVFGVVNRIAADLVQDQRSGAQYYPARINFTPGERERLGNLKIIPGMPVETFVQTGSRTVMSYLTKPLTDQVMRAFRGV
ncbi:HlyD family type I secretion periplasmic adaptor subunit [Bosea sp. BIWAKO-01]|uniref:HlyD family type I secretion periplasmic adaptor subunit n=1 Tax=Bosea sp. BIWAKO-01 TaxID=506668 RepID=UPI000852B76F|nr:HlyD family type I secretion periplasmic adaptor subunit [Bosea sp. BIWAKO-01]GAU81405.1 HlyD family secretion protein [Bosea sp. BIWAKO-01]